MPIVCAKPSTSQPTLDCIVSNDNRASAGVRARVHGIRIHIKHRNKICIEAMRKDENGQENQ